MADITPFAWQVEPVRILTEALRNERSAIDASDTGTGKTFTALFAVKALGLPVAVVCPKSVIHSWKEAAAKLGVPVIFIKNVEALKRDTSRVRQIGRRWQWCLPKECVVIFDEVHRFSSPTSQNGYLLAACPAKRTLLLSATAMSDPTKMRAIGHKLGLTTWEQWEDWCARHSCRRGDWGGLEFHGGAEVLDRIHRQIFHTGRGTRVRISDLGDAFPRNTHVTRLVPVANQRAIDEAYADELRTLEADAETHLAAMTRARQIAEHEKLPAMIEATEDFVAQGSNVVLGVNYRDSLDRLREAFPGCAVVYGGQNDRTENIDLFRRNKTSVCAVMMQAGGCGLNGLQDLEGRPRVSVYSPGWSAIDVQQFVGRIHRADSLSPSVQYAFFAEGTVDEKIREKVEAKKLNFSLLNDGDLRAS